jgi:serine/threonine protein kinase
MRHRHIISLQEVIETKSEIAMVMSYAQNGDMLSFMKKQRSLSEVDAKRIL